MTKQIGIWMDKREAKIISNQVDSEQLVTIKSNVEEFNPKGGSGTAEKGGPQDVVQDGKYLERQKHQLKGYFSEIASKLSDAESLVVFGPAETPQKFVDELENSNKALHKKIKGVKKADSMTENQLREWVREFFN